MSLSTCDYDGKCCRYSLQLNIMFTEQFVHDRIGRLICTLAIYLQKNEGTWKQIALVLPHFVTNHPLLIYTFYNTCIILWQ